MTLSFPPQEFLTDVEATKTAQGIFLDVKVIKAIENIEDYGPHHTSVLKLCGG